MKITKGFTWINSMSIISKSHLNIIFESFAIVFLVQPKLGNECNTLYYRKKQYDLKHLQHGLC